MITLKNELPKHLDYQNLSDFAASLGDITKRTVWAALKSIDDGASIGQACAKHHLTETEITTHSSEWNEIKGPIIAFV